MGLFQIGYRSYEGPRTHRAMRWLPITRTGTAIVAQSKLVRWITRFAYLPLFYLAPIFFFVGRATEPGGLEGPSGELSRQALPPGLVDLLQDDPSRLREAVWATSFAFMGSLQLWMVAVLTALVGPILISDDIRSRAFLIYFARPVSRLDYIVGKAGVNVSFLARVTLIPSLLLYAVSILFSPSLETILQTLPVLLKLILAGLGVIVPASLVMLTLSSIVRQPRYAAAGWISLCLFGAMVHPLLQSTQALQGAKWTFLLSPAETVRAFQFGLYDVRALIDEVGLSGDLEAIVEAVSSTQSGGLAAGWLLLVSLACLGFLMWRVEAPTRI